MSKDKTVPPASELCANPICGHPKSAHTGGFLSHSPDYCTAIGERPSFTGRCPCTSYVPSPPHRGVGDDYDGRLHEEAAVPPAPPTREELADQYKAAEREGWP